MANPITFRASESLPCPCCDSGSKGCSRTEDGLLLCRGSPQQGWKRISREADAAGFHHYRREDDTRHLRNGEPWLAKQPTPDSAKDWHAIASEYAAKLDLPRRRKLAVSLKLPVEALHALPLLGFNPNAHGPCFTFPEMNATGNIIGLNRRFKDGSKKVMLGGKRGLTLPIRWRDRTGPVFVVEGPTDAAAMFAAELACIGRPSNSGGVLLLADLFRDLDSAREIIIVGENDQKDRSKWPGRDGAELVARGLAAALRRPMRWTLPPVGAKDVRDWLTAETRSATTWPERGSELRNHLTMNAVIVPPPDDPPGAGVLAGNPNDGPDNPHRLATGFLDSISPPDSPRLFRFWRGEFHRYCDGAYRPVPDDDIRGELTQFIRAEFVRVNQEEAAAWRTTEREGKGTAPKVRPVTSRLIGDVLQALRGLCGVSGGVDAPAWIDGATGPDPAGLLPMRNGLLDLSAAAAGRADCLLPLSPSFFTPTAAPFAFDLAAPQPAEWLKFLRELWPNDPESIATLQEWFGYSLSPDTRQQKILFLLGPRRSGKGTIARVVRELIGPANVAGPTLGSLANNFGLSALLGKSVALISDARLSGRSDSAVIVERLLSISGEDALTIDRKHRDPLTVKLPTRFTISSNELPKLGDSSGALAGRLIVLRLTRSWFGKEDHHLSDRLRVELPGIFLWAVEGWRRLRERGRFIQPASGAELVEEMEDLSSPVGAFVRERCRVGLGLRVEVSELYAAWRSWCEEHGRKEPGTEETFGRDLRAVVPELKRTRPRTSEGRLCMYAGIRLRVDSDPDEPPPAGSSGQRGHGDQPLHASEEQNADGKHAEGMQSVGAALAGHADHVDRRTQPRRQRFANDDRPHEWRG